MMMNMVIEMQKKKRSGRRKLKKIETRAREQLRRRKNIEIREQGYD